MNAVSDGSRVLINCSNLHTGGGVAVATSFLDCLSRLDLGEVEVHVLCSTAVHRNLEGLGTNLGVYSSFRAVDFFGFSAFWKRLDGYFKNMDMVFTVFGPAYFLRKRTRHIFGFAQPNLIYPDNLYSRKLSALKRLRLRFKYTLLAIFFSRADSLVVELEHVQRQLRKNTFLKTMPVSIVYSSVHSIYFHPEKWEAVNLLPSSGRKRLGLISRNYPHKNLDILPAVKKALLSGHGLDFDFFVTFTPEEWSACSPEFRESIVNAGGLSLSQCPSFYAGMDGVIFPSLLECFSAVPIETMAMRKPLFASNLPFIIDVCGEFAKAFDPLNPRDIARVIAEYFCQDETVRQKKLDDAYVHSRRFPGPDERAMSYMGLIRAGLE